MTDVIKVGSLNFTLDELSKIRHIYDQKELIEFYNSSDLRGFRLNGKNVRDLIVRKLRTLTEQMYSETGKVPGLGIIQSGNSAESNTYVNIKAKKANEAGFQVFIVKFKNGAEQEEIIEKIRALECNDDVHGFIVQLPLLPEENFCLEQIITAINPKKDADCFHPYNTGSFYSGDSYTLAPATPQGTLMILQAYGVPLQDFDGKPFAAAISGRSDIAGKPFGRILESKSNNFNVSYHLMNSRTDTKTFFRTGSYQILISAIGRANYYTSNDIPVNTPLIIDVGVNFIKNPDHKHGEKGNASKEFIQVGDFHKDAYSNAKVVVPSPGGSGPGTVAALLVNTWNLACAMEKYKPKKT